MGPKRPLRALPSTAMPRLAGVLLAVGLSANCPAQFGGAGGAGGNLGGGNLGGGANQVGGILIDADGVLHARELKRADPTLAEAARKAFLAENLEGHLISWSDRRHVSLTRLERECERRLAAGEPLGTDLQHLAGLQRIDFLFADPGRREIILAGPAEGFCPDASGRMVGITTGRPPLRLDDLIVALRSAHAGNRVIGCSIDPEPQRLSRMQEFVARNSTQTSPEGAARRYRTMAEILGPHRISVFGVPADSHFALTLIEADFRMKRISLGVESSGVRGLRSHLSLITPGGNSIQRWWFAPLYDSLGSTGDRIAFQLSGQRVQLLAQEEIAAASGERSDAPLTRASTHKFAQLFTAEFPALAERSPLFAELQNLFDLVVVAALMEQESLVERAGHDAPLFAGTASELVPSFAVARQVPSMSTFRRARRGLVLGLVGGVTIDPQPVLRQFDSSGDNASRLVEIHAGSLQSAPPHLTRWWWD